VKAFLFWTSYNASGNRGPKPESRCCFMRQHSRFNILHTPFVCRRILCRHPFDEKKRVYVTPTAVIPLLRLVWRGSKAQLKDKLVPSTAPTVASFKHDKPSAHLPPPTAGVVTVGEAIAPSVRDELLSPSSLPRTDLRARCPSTQELRSFVGAQLDLIRADHLRPVNPTPYKISVSSELFHFCHELWMKEVPIPELA
jgi:hypothetical protein